MKEIAFCSSGFPDILERQDVDNSRAEGNEVRT